jgi:triacylglycerol lipase
MDSSPVEEDAAHPLGRLLGDLVVLAPSAAGPCIEEHTFPIETCHYGGVLHHQLQNHPALYAQIRETLSRDHQATGR